MPVDPTTHSPLGQRLAERTQPLAPDDAQNGYAHAALCEGMMLPFEQLAEIIDPPDPLLPWEPLFDVNLCPAWALPWLGQTVGVRIPRGMPEADARQMIKDLGLGKRGGPEAIKAGAGLALTGSKTVILHERDGGDAYFLEIVTLVSETPDPAALVRAVLLQKPAGIKFQLRTVEGWIYQDMTLTYTGQHYSDLKTDYTTYATLTTNKPI